jgi:hypothetical protein
VLCIEHALAAGSNGCGRDIIPGVLEIFLLGDEGISSSAWSKDAGLEGGIPFSVAAILQNVLDQAINVLEQGQE